jgi:hypothetical protein
VKNESGWIFRLDSRVKKSFRLDSLRPRSYFTSMPKCLRCDGTHWVCEAHDDRPWEGLGSSRQCNCGAAGMPCPDCNSKGSALPLGFEPDTSLHDIDQAGQVTLRETKH